LLSENLTPGDWIPIAESIRELASLDDVDGIIVFHGTDTMAYTAAALSFLLADLEKPVILTGSNLPPDQAGSDARRNAQDALVALESLGAGIYIVFAGGNDLPGLVHLGTRARKRQASGQAFASINNLPLAEIVEGRFRWVMRPSDPNPLAVARDSVDPRVLTLRLYPGLNFAAAFDTITAGDIRGVVIELYASATGPHTDDEYSLPTFVRRCVEDDIVVVTTVPAAPENPGNVYETTVAIHEAGAVFLADMLPETATVKLMWALAQVESADAVRTLMRRPIASELSPGA
jgi:L-asparaginase type I